MTSAHQAKRQAPKRKPAPQTGRVFTINGEKYTLDQVVEMVAEFDPTATVSRKTINARLERGHRDIKTLAADKLEQYRPVAMRGPRR